MRRTNNLISGCRLDNMDTYSNLLYVKEQRVELAHLAHRYYMQGALLPLLSDLKRKRHKQGCWFVIIITYSNPGTASETVYIRQNMYSTVLFPLFKDKPDWQVPNRDLLCDRQLLQSQVSVSVKDVNHAGSLDASRISQTYNESFIVRLVQTMRNSESL
jgi:hypothetical protein